MTSLALSAPQDCQDCDFRLAVVPPHHAAVGQAVLAYREQYPREVSARSPTYASSNIDPLLPDDLRNTWSSPAWRKNQTLGHFEPASLDAAIDGLVDGGGSTLSAFEALYGIVNEAGALQQHCPLSC